MDLMDLSILEARDKMIDALEDGIKRDLVPVEAQIFHHFSKDVYAREMRAPAKATITGKVHKFENLNILSQGALALFMDDGGIEIVRAPCHIVSPPGTRRAAYVLTDCVWTTVHGTSSRDLAEIEKHFVCQTGAEYRLFFEEQQRIAMNTTKEVA